MSNQRAGDVSSGPSFPLLFLSYLQLVSLYSDQILFLNCPKSTKYILSHFFHIPPRFTDRILLVFLLRDTVSHFAIHRVEAEISSLRRILTTFFVSSASPSG